MRVNKLLWMIILLFNSLLLFAQSSFVTGGVDIFLQATNLLLKPHWLCPVKL